MNIKHQQKVAFGMIVLNGDYVLEECLNSVYDYASQILIAEGPVKFWQNKGLTTSTDKTNYILDNFPDPKNKIKIIHSQYDEKDSQCNAYMEHLNSDIDYVWNLDCDEIYKQNDLEKIDKLLFDEKYTSVGVQSKSFFGGFENYLTGFEQNKDNFLRIFKSYPNCKWSTHRPPTIKTPSNITPLPPKHLDSKKLFDEHGVEMYHYSYVFPRQVYKKVEYYQSIGGTVNRIPNYFFEVFYPWVIGNQQERKIIEDKFIGVHEYLPAVRGPCYSDKFTGEHPYFIEKSLNKLKETFNEELNYVTEKLKAHSNTLQKNYEHIDNWKIKTLHEKQLQLNKNEYESKWPSHWDFLVKIGKENFNPETKVLDIGCGCGFFNLLLENQTPLIGENYTGIDYSENAMEIAKQNFSGNFNVKNYTDLTKDFTSNFDFGIISALTNVLPNGDEALNFLLSLNIPNLILLKILTTQNDFHCSTYTAYDTATTYKFEHNNEKFNQIIMDNGYKIIYNSGNEYYLKKNI
jgi:SAM-dependent methyltransferase